MQKYYIQIKSHSKVPGGHEFWETIFNPLPINEVWEEHNNGDLNGYLDFLTEFQILFKISTIAFPPVLGFLWSYVLFRYKGFESMVVDKKKEKENRMAAIRKH